MLVIYFQFMSIKVIFNCVNKVFFFDQYILELFSRQQKFILFLVNVS